MIMLSLDLSQMSTLHQSITTIYSDDKTDYSSHNLMHQRNDKIRIGEHPKVTELFQPKMGKFT